MEKKYLVRISIVLVLLIVLFVLSFKGKNDETVCTYGEVTRGDLSVTITSTGTLEAISTIDVGTQVSGKIAKLYVDFNSEVKKGQLLAVLDTVNLFAQVNDAKANLAKMQAEYKQKVTIHERNKKLYEKKYISELDFIQSATDVESALASLSSAEYALERAKINLGYAYIYAPIAGKIIDRSVEEGQTVAASLSAPTLFTIAEDLSSMRILASVDESDIGQIKTGQKVKFTVQAFSDKTFNGTVTQIRLKPTTSSNVVNYTVVINAGNKNYLLLPGMTATIDFYVDQRNNILLFPNTALRVELSDVLAKTIKKNMEDDFSQMPDSVKNRFKNHPALQTPLADIQRNGFDKNSMKTIYFQDKSGRIKMAPVIIGLTDGKNTQVLMSRELKEGTKILVGIQSDLKTENKSTNIISPGGGQNMPPPMM